MVGCGSIGRRHIGNLLALGVELVAWNRGDERRKAVAEDFGIKTYENLNEMMSDSGADAAVICSPSSIHVEDAMRAIAAHLHIFVEKPVGTNLDEVDRLVETAESEKVISHVGSNMRFHWGPRRVKQILDSGQIGRPLWGNFWGAMHLPDWHPEEDYRDMYSAKLNLGGGAVLDFIHELDLVLWMLGEPKRIAAMTTKSGWLDIETEDLVDVLLGFSGGLQVNVHLDYLQRPFQRGIRLVGTKGWVQWDLPRQIVESYDHATEVHTVEHAPTGYSHNDMYMEQMNYFLQCITSGTMSDGGLVSGRQALRLALQIRESSYKNEFRKGVAVC